MKLTAKHRKILGIIIFFISLLFWFLLFSLPWIPVKGKMKITVGTICLVMGEILFYLSAVILGRELYLNYKNKLHPRNWFKKKKLD